MLAINNALLLIVGASLRASKFRILYQWVEAIYIDRYSQKSIQRFIVTTRRRAQNSLHRNESHKTLGRPSARPRSFGR